jgi:5-carboxymethyl-2-hydroxymuconate isomerase
MISTGKPGNLAMPHITVEYSSNLEDGIAIRTLIDALHRTVEQSGLFDPAAIRTRALPRPVYRIADGNPANVFAHIIARIRAGRTVEERKRLGNALLETAKKAVSAMPAVPPIALTVEVHEIDPEMLFRYVTIK